MYGNFVDRLDVTEHYGKTWSLHERPLIDQFTVRRD